MSSKPSQQFKPIPRPVDAPIYVEYTTTATDNKSFGAYYKKCRKGKRQRLPILIWLTLTILAGLLYAITWTPMSAFWQFILSFAPFWIVAHRDIWTPVMTILSVPVLIASFGYLLSFLPSFQRLKQTQLIDKYFAATQQGIVTGTLDGLQIFSWSKVTKIDDDDSYVYIAFLDFAEASNIFRVSKETSLEAVPNVASLTDRLGISVPKRLFENPSIVVSQMRGFRDASSSDQIINLPLSHPMSEATFTLSADERSKVVMSFQRGIAPGRLKPMVALRFLSGLILLSSIVSSFLIYIAYEMNHRPLELQLCFVVAIGTIPYIIILIRPPGVNSSPVRALTPSSTFPVTMKVRDECLSVEAKGRLRAYAWNRVTKILHDQSDLIIWIDRKPTLIVPKTAFSSEPDCERFADIFEAVWRGKPELQPESVQNKSWPPAPRVNI